MIQYYFDNTPLCSFKGWTESWTGLFSALDRKEPERVDYPGQHGYRFDRSAIRFKERVITMTLVFNTNCRHELIRDEMKRFMELLSKNRPIRLMREDTCANRIDVWELDWVSSDSDRWFDDQMGQRTLTFHEVAPVKAIYKSDENTASLTINSPYTLLIFWGDGSFDKVKHGTISHQYTDNIRSHYIIVSGVLTKGKTETDVQEVTTNMQGVCRILC